MSHKSEPLAFLRKKQQELDHLTYDVNRFLQKNDVQLALNALQSDTINDIGIKNAGEYVRIMNDIQSTMFNYTLRGHNHCDLLRNEQFIHYIPCQYHTDLEKLVHAYGELLLTTRIIHLYSTNFLAKYKADE